MCPAIADSQVVGQIGQVLLYCSQRNTKLQETLFAKDTKMMQTHCLKDLNSRSWTRQITNIPWHTVVHLSTSCIGGGNMYDVMKTGTNTHSKNKHVASCCYLS